METDVQLDEQGRPRPASSERSRKTLRGRDAVHRHCQLDLAGNAGETLPLVGAERWVVDEDLRRSRFLKDLRLTRLGDRQPAGSELELPETDLGGLVRLRVRPERNPVRVCVRLQVA